MLDKLVPLEYQWLAKALIVAALLTAAALAGATVRGWQKDASFAEERQDLKDTIASKQRDIASLESGIKIANTQIASYAMRTTQAEKTADLALEGAASSRVAAEKRIDRLRSMQAKDCAEVLDNYTRIQP